MSKIEETGSNNSRDNFNNLSKNSKLNKKKLNANYSKLSNMRVIQKRLVYVIGLSSNLAFKDSQLSKFEYFGQYGRIMKLVVNKNKVYNANGPNGPSYSAYITYSTPEECSLAILALDNTLIDDHILRASYGTTKYCSNFLKGVDCFNKDCLYLHFFAEESDIIDRDDMNTNKSIFSSQHILAMRVADIFNPEKKSRLLAMKINKTVLPSPHTIYEKEIVIEHSRNREDKRIEKLNSVKIRKSIYEPKEKSRFDFATSTNITPEESIDIPSFVSNLISLKTSRYTLFKNLSKDDSDFTYFNKTLIKELSVNNSWARFIVTQHNNQADRIYIEQLAKNEENSFLKKFNSA